MVPVVTRRAVADDNICGLPVARGTYIACSIQAVHQSWKDADTWRPERFLPGGEFDSFPPDIQPYMVSLKQVFSLAVALGSVRDNEREKGGRGRRGVRGRERKGGKEKRRERQGGKVGEGDTCEARRHVSLCLKPLLGSEDVAGSCACRHALGRYVNAEHAFMCALGSVKAASCCVNVLGT